MTRRNGPEPKTQISTLVIRNSFGVSSFGIRVWIWLSGLDSNQDKGLQRALCYRYTTGQYHDNVTFGQGERKAKVSIGKNKQAFLGPGQEQSLCGQFDLAISTSCRIACNR